MLIIIILKIFLLFANTAGINNNSAKNNNIKNNNTKNIFIICKYD